MIACVATVEWAAGTSNVPASLQPDNTICKVVAAHVVSLNTTGQSSAKLQGRVDKLATSGVEAEPDGINCRHPSLIHGFVSSCSLVVLLTAIPPVTYHINLNKPRSELLLHRSLTSGIPRPVLSIHSATILNRHHDDPTKLQRSQLRHK